VLAQAGIRLGDLDVKTAGTLDIAPATDQPVPAVGLDFRI
jgi:hypothetical protein